MKTACKVMVVVLGGCAALWAPAARAGGCGPSEEIRPAFARTALLGWEQPNTGSIGVHDYGGCFKCDCTNPTPYCLYSCCGGTGGTDGGDDAGVPDAGTDPDAGVDADAGLGGGGGGGGGDDAGVPDAGVDADAGTGDDAGAADAGDVDAGPGSGDDAGSVTPGGPPPPPPDDGGVDGGQDGGLLPDGGPVVNGPDNLRYVGGGCSCGGPAGALNLAFLLAFGLALSRHRAKPDR